jgi:hypothetical protein
MDAYSLSMVSLTILLIFPKKKIEASKNAVDAFTERP